MGIRTARVAASGDYQTRQRIVRRDLDEIRLFPFLRRKTAKANRSNDLHPHSSSRQQRWCCHTVPVLKCRLSVSQHPKIVRPHPLERRGHTRGRGDKCSATLTWNYFLFSLTTIVATNVEFCPVKFIIRRCCIRRVS
jgi:hypothetical protein